jgi:hypothetical protein
MSVLEHNLYQILQRALTIAITWRSGRFRWEFGYFFLSTYLVILTFLFTN